MKILRIFPETAMYYSHQGLRSIAAKNKIDVDELEMGEFLVFINKRLNSVKILTAGNVLCYLKTIDQRRLEMKTIQMIPAFFEGSQFKYDKALEQVLRRVA